ncbi:chorismate mutase [Ruegeria sp. 2012CJ41-6]|uniref:chorismate mutase n=1 Tax=Ruegeria spongiae TaxID=2942209 RepID=A0ABT0Q8Q0_9RHOB|nr:chorismate mutase [Ruegeria spongiae]MCL6286203.1 chorismate mutase [Ruegeria spongiae]
MPPLKAPQDCETMQDLRVQIDRLDQHLVELLRTRATYIDRASQLKPGEGLPARIPARVEEVVAKVRARADGAGLDPDLAERLWRILIDWSITREEQVLGPD